MTVIRHKCFSQGYFSAFLAFDRGSVDRQETECGREENPDVIMFSGTKCTKRWTTTNLNLNVFVQYLLLLFMTAWGYR